MLHHDKNNKGRLGILAQHKIGLKSFKPSPAFVMLTGVRKRLLPLTKREGLDSVINSDFKSKISTNNENNFPRKELSALVPQYLSNFFDTNHSQLTTHHSLKSKVAFTLAEVLITLGIIGIVAALTLPALIENYKKEVIINKLNKVYSTISQAYVSAKADNGDMQNWKLVNYLESENDDEDILYYLLPYLNVQKFCGKSEKGCFPDVAYASIGSKNFGININVSKWYSKAILADGTVISSITFSDNGILRVDINGNNPPNTLGIDLFSFFVLPEKIVPFGVVGVGGASSSNDFYINRGDYCTAWVIYGKTMDYIKDKKCEPYK